MVTDMLRLLCAGLVLTCGQAINPAFAEKIVVYHVNQATYGAAPVNMNTGDARGDLFFDLRSVDLPIECAHPSPWTSHDCDNAEVISNDLVITKLILEVDSSKYGQYGRCNVCVNGTDHHGNNTCKDGVYSCACGGFRDPAPCNASVGKINVTTMYASHDGHQCRDEVDCWKINTVFKTGGFWYSTTAAGWCDAPGADQKKCTWRVAKAVKRVNKTCSDNQIYDTMETHDRSAKGAGCFSKCGGTGPHRNTTDPCWIGCFYENLLGPNATRPQPDPDAGIDTELLLAQGWNAPFESDDPAQGGCPAMPLPHAKMSASVLL